MNIAMVCKKNWYQYLAVNIFSLLKCTDKVKKIYLLLETDDINDVPKIKEIIEKYPVEIELINFNNVFNDFVDKGIIKENTIYSKFCFAKLAFPYLIEDDKLLYINTDALVIKDISYVWNLNMDDYYVAGCKDYGAIMDDTYSRLKITGKYINDGFILFNLNKIREEKIHDKWFENMNSDGLKRFDQDALNLACQHKELYIPSMFNYIQDVTKEVMVRDRIKVINYNVPNENQWVQDMFYAELWYDIETMFYEEFGE